MDRGSIGGGWKEPRPAPCSWLRARLARVVRALMALALMSGVGAMLASGVAWAHNEHGVPEDPTQPPPAETDDDSETDDDPNAPSDDEGGRSEGAGEAADDLGPERLEPARERDPSVDDGPLVEPPPIEDDGVEPIWPPQREDGSVSEGDDAGTGDEEPPLPPLPENGRADRPVLPHLDVELLGPGEGLVGQGAATVSLGKIGEDLFVNLVVGAVIAGDGWSIAPRVPLRLRVLDEAPETSDVLRLEDWDEPSDFARLLAFFQWGRPGEDLYIRVGELNGVTLGHGTLIGRYYNTIDIDHYQGGVYVSGDAGFLGAEWMLDDLFGPSTSAARLFARPFDLFEELPVMLRKLKIGVTGGADFAAPVRVATDDSGGVLYDDNFRAVVDEHRPLALFGVDLEVPLVSVANFDLVPYVDLNLLDMDSVGLHAGLYATVRFDPLTTWRNRLEYRLSGAGYMPEWVGPFYEVHRLRFQGDQTKLGWRAANRAEGQQQGVYVESELNVSGLLNLALVVSEDEGPDNTDVLFRLLLPELGPFRLSLFFARLDFHGAEQFFDLDQTVFAATGRWYVVDWFYVRFRVVNEWWLSRGGGGASTYETVTDFDAGVGLSLEF